ncbi:MAG: glycosyltransferase family 2 protein [Candidatus Sumerlaeia bacterium]|nr:glycosyltransferase family 2 protein [Candidatus Sumerlaeia bacterium]
MSPQRRSRHPLVVEARRNARPKPRLLPEGPATVDLTLIIVHRGGVALLRNCLNSLPAACEGLTWEAVVVDNGSTDGSQAMVRAEFPGIRLLDVGVNLGFTRGNNLGLRYAHGRHICLLNNDTVSLPGCFAKALAVMDADPTIGVAGLKLLNEDGSRQLSCRRFPSFQQALFNRYSLLTKLFPQNPYSRSYLMPDVDDSIRDVDWVSGACMVIPRRVVEKIGGLDEQFFMYSEDVDFCLRVWKAGWRVIYLPVGEVYHLIGQTSGRFPFMPLTQRHLSMYKFYKKHYSRELLFLDLLTGLMVLLRLALQLTVVFLGRLGRR